MLKRSKASGRNHDAADRPRAKPRCPGGDGFWLEVLEMTKKLESMPLSVVPS